MTVQIVLAQYEADFKDLIEFKEYWESVKSITFVFKSITIQNAESLKKKKANKKWDVFYEEYKIEEINYFLMTDFTLYSDVCSLNLKLR